MEADAKVNCGACQACCRNEVVIRNDMQELKSL